jgi:hypothetical protein
VGRKARIGYQPPKKENLVYTVASVPALNSSFNSYIRAQAQPVAKSATLMKAHSTFFPRGASPVGLGDAALELDAVVGVLDALPDPFAEAELSELLSSSSLLFGMTTPPWMVAGLVETFTLFAAAWYFARVFPVVGGLMTMDIPFWQWDAIVWEQ